MAKKKETAVEETAEVKETAATVLVYCLSGNKSFLENLTNTFAGTAQVESGPFEELATKSEGFDIVVVVSGDFKLSANLDVLIETARKDGVGIAGFATVKSAGSLYNFAGGNGIVEAPTVGACCAAMTGTNLKKLLAALPTLPRNQASSMSKLNVLCYCALALGMKNCLVMQYNEHGKETPPEAQLNKTCKTC